MNFAPYTAFFLFPVMVVLLEAGRALRRRWVAESSSAVEGAVFALFGLLLAFTFSGAISRYDEHKKLGTEEANDIGTAYLRLSLLPADSQPQLRRLFREYVDSRLHIYDAVGDAVTPETVRMQNAIWQQSLAAASASGANADATKLLLPAINEMIDITSTRQNVFHMHPPAVVFLLLYAFSGIAAFMAGYGMKSGDRDWVYTAVFAVVVTLTVYATLEIEYPRQGLIRLTELDRGMVALRDSMR